LVHHNRLPAPAGSRAGVRHTAGSRAVCYRQPDAAAGPAGGARPRAAPHRGAAGRARGRRPRHREPAARARRPGGAGGRTRAAAWRSRCRPRSRGSSPPATRPDDADDALWKFVVDDLPVSPPQDPESVEVTLWSRTSRENTEVSLAGAALQRPTRLFPGTSWHTTTAHWLAACC